MYQTQVRRAATAVCIIFVVMAGMTPADARDFFVTIGGGYVPEQNQASLEANVLFFQRILNAMHHGDRRHDVFFADGHDAGPDLQIPDPRQPDSAPPETLRTLLSRLHRRGPDRKAVAYRNHEVPDLSGGNSPELIHKAIERVAADARSGDRLLVYVTAHGHAGSREFPHNTTISCWNNTSITVQDFSEWLDELPEDLPVIMVMAQCYCGGFGDTIFANSLERNDLSHRLRIGFFAQQHDLPAAGCRPDIEHDQEFSSYFWGAIIGETRNGQPMAGCDADGNGEISFDEAFAQAMIVGKTIDMPLKSSSVLLRTYSQIPNYTLAQERFGRRSRGSRSNNDSPRSSDDPPAQDASPEDSAPAQPSRPQSSPPQSKMSGTIAELASQARPAARRTIVELCVQLDIDQQTTVEELLEAHQQHRQRRFSSGRRRSSSGRRELLEEIAKEWPELAEPKDWAASPLLKDDQAEVLAGIQQLRAYATYKRRAREREQRSETSTANELKEVLYRRLIDTLEDIVLERNLPVTASESVTQHFRKMVLLEQTTLMTNRR